MCSFHGCVVKLLSISPPFLRERVFSFSFGVRYTANHSVSPSRLHSFLTRSIALALALAIALALSLALALALARVYDCSLSPTDNEFRSQRKSVCDKGRMISLELKVSRLWATFIERLHAPEERFYKVVLFLSFAVKNIC